MHLLKTSTPFFDTQTIVMLCIIFVIILFWVIANMINRARDRRDLEMQSQQRLIERLNTPVSTPSNTVFKN